MRLVGEGAWGEPSGGEAAREAARNVLRRAVELGIDLIGYGSTTTTSTGPC